MKRRRLNAVRGIAFLAVWCLALSCDHAPAQQIDPATSTNQARKVHSADGLSPVDFVRDVQPILRDHCYECHSGNNEEGELNLAIRAKAMSGGANGPVLVPGKSDASRLIQLVSGRDPDRMMPPEDEPPLTADQIAVLRRWVNAGADWPTDADVTDPKRQKAQQHWAYLPLRAVRPPDEVMVRHAPQEHALWRSQSPIDLFILQRLADEGIVPSSPADATTLIRRLFFDLHGLPPTPQQVDAFRTSFSRAPRATVNRWIDALLESHHFGERWARHWLDVARYAESDGQESDRDRPHAYHYRDFVIEALNQDMPFDQFVRWQIAGDEYRPDDDRAVSATGFLTAGPSMKLKDSFLERERLFNRYNELDDIVTTLGTGLLGLTVGCARCHDHKYDAFTSREYYQLLAAFHSGDRVSAKLPSGRDGFFFQDFGDRVRTTWLFRRSDFYDREIEVDLGFPEILAKRTASEYWESAKQAYPNPPSTLQRRALADWITDVDDGAGALLARVIVNRIWQHHFGHGLVRTPSDFGVRGESPSHPELLEFLAHDLVAHGWQLKRLHRMILRSAAWQRSGDPVDPMVRQTNRQIDPQNRLLWKRDPQRLEAEVLRDAMLSISDTLNLHAGGPGFKPFIPPEANLARNIQGGDYPKDAKDDATTRRRSVYMFHKRLVPYPLFQAFDRPDLLVSCARRQNTTVAPQALALMNDRFVRAVAKDFAVRLINESGIEHEAIVRASFQYALAREATETERSAAIGFIQSQTHSRQSRGQSDADVAAVADYCQTLFGLNEFLYVD